MSTMSQLGEFLATIQNQQDARTAELEARLAELEGKKECECAESITALEERLATLESKEECGCAETISTLEARLATLESKEECGCAETITALEARLAELESKEECGCGSYDELLASYEERISALEGNTGGSTEGEGEGGSTEGEGEGGSTEGEGGSTEGEGGEEGGSTEPMTASQALEKYDHLISISKLGNLSRHLLLFMSMHDNILTTGSNCFSIDAPAQGNTVASLLGVVNGKSVKVYTPDLQEITIIVDSTMPYLFDTNNSVTIAIGNKTTKKVNCYAYNTLSGTISPCSDEEFIATWGNSDALGL